MAPRAACTRLKIRRAQEQRATVMGGGQQQWLLTVEEMAMANECMEAGTVFEP